MTKQKSIAKSYDKIAHEYTQAHGYGEHSALPSLKTFTRFARRQCKIFTDVAICNQKSKILDVGCGGGQDSKYLFEQGYSVFGVDVSKEMIKLAKKYSPKTEFAVADVMSLPARIKYEGIWCCRVFHHISMAGQNKFLKKLNTLLKKDGVLFISCAVSDTKEDYEAFDSGSDGLLKKRLTAKSFKSLLEKNNFTILKFRYWVGKKGMEIFTKK
ncbi:MAG: S-adenosyl-L-methionine-dependent methyltransferase [Parcubacteria group bacterium GW2011_GWC2_38_7]|nr:MAG: S-adenosyl-L-methionine-dependent methyltransferase [Parcubacteria group bacterium GW2011_GWC2_38_7]